MCNFSNTLFRDIWETKARESTKRMSGEKQCFEETKREKRKWWERRSLYFVCLLSKNRFGEPIRDALSGNKTKTKTNFLKNKKRTVHSAQCNFSNTLRIIFYFHQFPFQHLFSFLFLFSLQIGEIVFWGSGFSPFKGEDLVQIDLRV